MAEIPTTTLAGLAMVPAQAIMNQQAAEQQNQWSRENMMLSNQLQHEQNRSATTEAVRSMRDAGLNPASMKGPMSPASAPAPAQGAKIDTFNVMSSMAQLANLEADIKLKNAQTEKTIQEANTSAITNNRENTADAQAKEQAIANMKSNISLLKSHGINTDELQNRLQNLIDSDNFNLGNFKGALEAHNFDVQDFGRLTSQLENLYKQNNVEYLLKTDSKLEAHLLQQRLALDTAMTYATYNKADVDEKQLEVMAKQLEKFDAEIAKMQADGQLSEAQANNIRNGDMNTLWKEGKEGEAMRALGFQTAVAGAQGFGAGLGYGTSALLTRGASLKGVSLPSSKAPLEMPKYQMKSLALGNGGVNPFTQGSKNAQTFSMFQMRVGRDKAMDIYGKFLKSRERKKYGNDFTAWLGAYERSHGKYPY